ncbi:unnamed protein product [Clavelina lepadiformis]|uniref:Protein kinase domain-containing protein n=1 Tax=Clavelina lepadiformis TaxID=159417 RepID=A0ABP0GMF6_CLALP
MEEELKRIKEKLDHLCETIDQVMQHGVAISDRVTTQDKKIDVILNKVSFLTSESLKTSAAAEYLKFKGTERHERGVQTSMIQSTADLVTEAITSKPSEMARSKSSERKMPSPVPITSLKLSVTGGRSRSVGTAEREGVMKSESQPAMKFSRSSVPAAPNNISEINVKTKPSLQSCKSSPAITNFELEKKSKKKESRDDKFAAESPSCDVIKGNLKSKKQNKVADKRRMHSVKHKEGKTPSEERGSHKKVSCESGVFSDDGISFEGFSDDVIYKTVLSNREALPEASTEPNTTKNKDYESAEPRSNASNRDVKSPLPDNSEIEQNQNPNHERRKSNSDVTSKLTIDDRPNANGFCDVTIKVEDCLSKTGADNDKQRVEVIGLLDPDQADDTNRPIRRASYAGLGKKEKEAFEGTNKKTMTPASHDQEEEMRPRSSCELRSCGAGKSDAGSFAGGSIVGLVNRQFSNSSTGSAPSGIQITLGGDSDSDEESVEIDLPELPHPKFSHRIVTIKSSTYKHFYDLKEAIGGGRFGRVHRCVEKKTGLQLAAKLFQCKKPVAKTLLKAKSLKQAQNLKTKRTQQEPVDKTDVLTEIAIMNQIDHPNIVKLYDAYENDNTMTLILEYLGGGELFERVLADQAQLTELDAVLFMRQISLAVQYLHKNLILHLDLKPENILCLDRSTHHIKIIDFGLARKYNPRQKLMIQWGTPEFMAPEVLNYEVVSFPSDMWSVGVICYILLSGMSPFLGDDDSETMQNITDCDWGFEEPPFKFVSEDAKDFISRLLVEEKSGRMSAAQCLRHAWLSTPLTSKRRKTLMNKTQLKNFMARIHWKASLAAVSAANWLIQKVSSLTDDVTSNDTAV